MCIPKSSLRIQHQESLDCLDRALALYKPEGLAFSFNGGKDSVVALHLLRAALHKRGQRMSDVLHFYFVRKDEFPEIEDFVRASDQLYEMKMQYMTGDFKGDIQRLVDTTPVRGIVLGTRKGDPNADDQDKFCPSSHNWPAFMRINPIINWTYDQVWSFLRLGNLPYSPLYDQGYT